MRSALATMNSTLATMNSTVAECSSTRVPLFSDANIYFVIFCSLMGVMASTALCLELEDLASRTPRAAAPRPDDRSNDPCQPPAYGDISSAEKGMPLTSSTPYTASEIHPTGMGVVPQPMSSAEAFVRGTVLLHCIVFSLSLFTYTVLFYRHCSAASNFTVNTMWAAYLMLCIICSSEFTCWIILGARLFGCRWTDDFPLLTKMKQNLMGFPTSLVVFCQECCCSHVLDDEEAGHYQDLSLPLVEDQDGEKWISRESD
ncbi:hypothetical protein K461DRAFT_289432 [Myriangium duriaei CBS 260.36]|uniref:Transmembrane protein n=1 Tax=Myriangium duriaei CBS 260.36 TaxID=1168546 RepID=A0A9P4JBL1_9PEZI|nr:hypothetical protein K461DRAFT_289432 [Myriangium duriaei CBS 260.36]